MINLTYRRMVLENDTDIPRLTTIYHSPTIARYLSISDNYFHYVTNNENVYFYKVYENGRLIGSTHLEKQENVLFMDILVFPEFQRMGLGTRIVKDIQNDVLGLDYVRIEISIDESNIASLKLFENAGFIRTSKEDELINFAYSSKNQVTQLEVKETRYEKED